jgi:hypothetical protein
MPFMTRHDVQRGLRRLLAAPRDLPPCAPWRDPPVEKAEASEPHREAHGRYLEHLGVALDMTEPWWRGMMERFTDQGRSPEDAMNEVYRTGFAGPASSPHVVWVVRTYWLECVAINESLPEPQRVPPEVFLLHWLVQDQRTEAVQVLSGMPYWPIGLSAEGRWT